MMTATRRDGHAELVLYSHNSQTVVTKTP